MTEAARFTADEERAIRDAFSAHRELVCPRDGSHMTAREIGGGSFGLGYARLRQWLICPSCRRSVIFDQKRGTRT